MDLETEIDELMPGLHPRWKYLLLEESLGKMTASEVARRILKERGRRDVKVCFSQNEQNCYSPMLNLIGLSEDVAGSCSVMAVAIAAHEVGHALQVKVVEKLGRTLKISRIFSCMSSFGEIFMLFFGIIRVLKNTNTDELQLASSIESEAKKQGSTQGSEIHQSQRNLKHYRFINLTHLRPLAIAFLKWVVILLLFPIRFLILVVCQALFGILVVLSICCALICRWLVFVTEIHASLVALRLLKQYKVLGIHQQKAARKFLLACALTYLRSSAVDRLFA
jgi:Zn-dependent membrane protease YugP